MIRTMKRTLKSINLLYRYGKLGLSLQLRWLLRINLLYRYGKEPQVYASVYDGNVSISYIGMESDPR